MLFPISFSFPAEKIVTAIPPKTKILATCVPGNLNTYVFNNEQDYYHDYQKSLFAITKKKAGWDALRHYEILANGCIPLFEDLDECPVNTIMHFPKSMVRDAKKLYLEIKDLSFDEINNNYLEKYNKIISNLLEYTRSNLTTVAMAKYVLNTIRLDNIKNILFLSGNSKFGLQPDYLRCLLLHGFKKLFGNLCHDYPCIPHLYIDFGNVDNLYGKGATYSKLLNKNEYRNEKLDESVLNDIRNKKYDLIIYGSTHRGMPFLETVLESYNDNKNKVIFFCGEDIHDCQLGKNIIIEGYTVFVREIC